MSKAELYVFSSPTCPHCPTAKAIAQEFAENRDDVLFKDVLSGTAGAQKLFKKFEVVSVPTIVIRGPGYPHNIGLRGAQGKDVLTKYVNMALGRETPVEDKQGFWSRLFFSK